MEQSIEVGNYLVTVRGMEPYHQLGTVEFTGRLDVNCYFEDGALDYYLLEIHSNGSTVVLNHQPFDIALQPLTT